VKALGIISLLVLAGCSVPHHDVSVMPLEPPASQPKDVIVSFSTNAWVRGVTSDDIQLVKSVLAQPGDCQIDGPIISLGKDSTTTGERMMAYTPLRYYEFTRSSGTKWHLLRCGAYNADSF
jgi:hypothetical protein